MAAPSSGIATTGPITGTQYVVEITPTDVTTTLLSPIPMNVYVGTGGTVRAVFPDGDIVDFVNVADGSILPIRPVRISATGTTASNMVALF